MRRTQEVTITLDNRDKGKTFLITELPASEAEEWAMRAILALTNNGVEIPDEVMAQPSLAGIAFVGTRALGQINPNDAIPLFKKMMSCVQFVAIPNGVKTPRPLVEGGPAEDIEDVPTRLLLREEVISLHLGFSIRGAVKTIREDMAKKIVTKPRASGRTKTSRRR